MSKLKQMQLNIAHLIDNTADQEILVNLFIDVKTGGASAMLRNKTAQTIIDLKSIYGKKMDEAVTILLKTEHSVNLTESGGDDGIQTKDRPDSDN
jgi:hypothetical protein